MGVFEGNWELVEYCNIIGMENFAADDKLAQLYRFHGDNESLQAEEQKKIWILSSIGKKASADSHFTNLLQKSLMAKYFEPYDDIFMTTFVNHPISELFTLLSHKSESSRLLRESIEKWYRQIAPSFVVTISAGEPAFYHSNLSDTIVEHIVEFSERPAYSLEEYKSQGSAQKQKNFSTEFGDWVSSQDIAYLHFSVDESKKSYDELAQNEWRALVGPALKWLVEGQAVQPELEDQVDGIEIIPPLEMPAEFLNL